MSSLKCPRCGFVNWVDTSACKRCGAAVCLVDATAQPAAPGRPYGYAPAPQRPGWVALGLFGIKTRAGAMAWLVAGVILSVSVAAAVFYLLAEFVEAPVPLALIFTLLIGGTGLLAPLWYWLSIRWMDAHEAWPARR